MTKFDMRLISYNILDGGEGRADPLAEILIAQRPDIAALVEAVDTAVLDRLAARLDMDYIQAPGATQASALFSRWTIRDSINHGAIRAGLSKSLLEATVIAPDGRPWIVGVLHLHDGARESDEAQRERELDIVLDLFSAHRRAGTPHLLAGDFNANSPIQKIDPQRCKLRTRQEWADNGGQIPRRVVQRLLDNGYIDALAAAAPELAANSGTFSTQYPGQRVDYIFAHGIEPSRITSAWLEQDRLAKYASDHFPIGAEIATKSARFDAAIARFDEANARDPNGKELLYSRRMTEWMGRLAPDASEPLRLATRCQHIMRWMIPRSGYPTGRAGYHRWRTELQQFHAETAGQILRDVGYDNATIARVQSLVKKQGLGTDPEVQLLEDVICLVFLESYFADFSARHDSQKIIGILRKTWAKMSPRARELALGLPLALPQRALIEQALAQPPTGGTEAH
jgi:endonuclease/exonuclease/phosphatase family metal-dependent hydrolase